MNNREVRTRLDASLVYDTVFCDVWFWLLSIKGPWFYESFAPLWPAQGPHRDTMQVISGNLRFDLLSKAPGDICSMHNYIRYVGDWDGTDATPGQRV